MDRLTNAADVKEGYERDHADPANGIKSARDYVDAGHERPWWNQGSIADKDELERFKAVPRPPKQTTVVIELDDVVRATAKSILDALKLDGVEMKDLESRFLFHCKGFGTPTNVINILDSMPYTPVKAVPGLMYGLHALHAMGYKVCIATSRPDDAKTKEWLETWLVDHGIYVGKGEVVSEIFYLGQTDGHDPDQVVDRYRSTHPQDQAAPPKDCPLDAEDVALVEGMRKAELDGTILSLNRLLDMIRDDKETEEVVYLDPSRTALEVFGSYLQDQRITHVHLVLFDVFAWNETRLDWNERGAWMTYAQRQEHGEKLGESIPAEMEGMRRAEGWSDMVRLLDPDSPRYLWGMARNPADARDGVDGSSGGAKAAG